MSYTFKLPEPYRDVIYCNTELHFSWKDRLKILFGSVPTVRVETFVENPPGRLESKSSVLVPRVIQLKVEKRGWAESGSPKGEGFDPIYRQ